MDILGKLVCTKDELKAKRQAIKQILQCQEFVYLATCNRILMISYGQEIIKQEQIKKLLLVLNPALDFSEIYFLIEKVKHLSARQCIEHVFSISASLDSLVVGEKEILGQFKKAYEFALQKKMCGTFLQLLCDKTILTAKEIFLKTSIAQNPVSVMSLAYRKWKSLVKKKQHTLVIIGAGKTIASFCQYLQEDYQLKVFFF